MDSDVQEDPTRLGANRDGTDFTGDQPQRGLDHYRDV
jgi:hypothetical protein